MVPDSTIQALQRLVGTDHVLLDPDLTAGYRRDWTGRFHCGPLPVVRPGSTDEVRGVVKLANDARFHLVPQGGNTGLVGGSVPTSGDSVVVSTRRLADIGAADLLGSQILVGAGATLGALQRALVGTGWMLGVDLGARESCTIGGMVSTNAGGITVVRHGTMRRQILGIEAVLGDGSVVSHLNGLEKDNTGYDIDGLLTGSEGTLGIVTKVLLRLRAAQPCTATAMLGFASVDMAVEAAARLRRSLSSLESLELMLPSGTDLVGRAFGYTLPAGLTGQALLLVEVAGGELVADELAAACHALAALLSAEPAVALTPTARALLWRWREEHTAAIATVGVPLKLDISIPQKAIARFIDDVFRAATATAFTPIIFGHLGDGNLHVNFPDCFPSDGSGAMPHATHQLEVQVLELVAAHGGSISAEHGIGVAKAPYLGMTRSVAEIAAFRRLKSALDPNGVLNPGVILTEATD